jgi:chromosome segregation ATPase
MSELDNLVSNLKQIRDELKLQIHLAKKDAQDEWEDLEDKMEDLVEKAGLAETGEGVKGAVEELGEELKLGYERIREAIKSAD